MTYSFIIRAALAVTLVIASPAGLCCCAGSGSPCSGNREVPGAVASHGARSQSSCCDSEEATGGPSDEDHDRPSCGCGNHDRQADLVRAAILPTSDDDSPLPPAVPAIGPESARQATGVSACAHGPPVDQRSGCARTESLFALHALMTV